MKTSIIVQNLKCGGCAKTITSKISEVKNILGVMVDVESSTVSFEYQNSADTQVVKDKLKSLGYPTIGSKNSIAAKAFSFVSCATGKVSKS